MRQSSESGSTPSARAPTAMLPRRKRLGRFDGGLEAGQDSSSLRSRRDGTLPSNSVRTIPSNS